MLEKINNLLNEVSVYSVNNPEELELYRLKFLSKKGLISDLFEDFRNVPAEAKKEVGQKLNLLKQNALEKFNILKSKLVSHDDISSALDLSLPSIPFSLGSRHPISIVRNEIINIFTRLGFTVSEGPEIEDDDHVFTKA